MTSTEDLELTLKGLLAVRTILECRGLSAADLEQFSAEIVRVRARLRTTEHAEGGGAHSVAA